MNKKFRDIEEGPLVFASPNLAVATIFMTHAHSSGLFDDIPYAVIVADHDEFIRNDTGGHIYSLTE